MVGKYTSFLLYTTKKGVTCLPVTTGKGLAKVGLGLESPSEEFGWPRRDTTLCVNSV